MPASAHVTVYPTKASALNVRHPGDGRGPLPLAVGGSQWPHDGFTMRLITEGSITRDPAKAWNPDVQPAAATSAAAAAAPAPAAADTATKK